MKEEGEMNGGGTVSESIGETWFDIQKPCWAHK